MRMIEKRAQGWGFDLVVASIIFSFAIILFYIFAFNYSTGGEETFNNLAYEGQLVAESILSEGYPPDWNNNSVVRIGILSGNKINQTKLERFYNMTNVALNPGEYNRTKVLFNIAHDYNISFSSPVNILGSEVYSIGRTKPNPENLIRVTRFSIYNNKPITLDIDVST